MAGQRRFGRATLTAARRLRQEDNGRAIAVFTGAGASVPFGYPVTGALLPRILKWRKNKEFLCPGNELDGSVARTRRRRLADAIDVMIPNIGGKRDLPLVTTLISLLDLAIAKQQPLWPRSNASDLSEVRQLFDQAIIEALGEENPFSRRQALALKRYARWLHELRGAGRDVGIITTNYDSASNWGGLSAVFQDTDLRDWCTEEIAARIDYGMEWRDVESGQVRSRPSRPDMRSYKLHGSTNWLRCPACQHVYVNESDPTIWYEAARDRMTGPNRCHCSRTRLEWQIVSPSFVRQMNDPNLLSIWNNAQGFLARASHWVLIGYSLPDEDISLRALFTRALNLREDALDGESPRVTVVQVHDERLGRDETRPKYETLFGGCDLRYVTEGFASFLDAWDATAAGPARRRSARRSRRA